MLILQIVFLLSVCGCPQALRLPISDILEIANLSKDVTNDVLKTIKLLDDDEMLPNEKKWMLAALTYFNFFKFDMFNRLDGIGLLSLRIFAVYIDLQSQLKLKLMEATKNIEFISLRFTYMGTLIKNMTDFDSLIWEEFARSIVSPSDSSLQSVLHRSDAIIELSVFEILIENMKGGNKMFCDMLTSAQQLVLYIYNTLALAKLKGFFMIQFSYMLLKLHDQGNFRKEIKAAQEWYKDRSATTLSMIIEAVQLAPRELWKCDPDIQVKNETYIEITELLQGYIENEADMRAYIGRGCNRTCKTFYSTDSYNCNNSGGQHTFCNKNRRCKGNIFDCQFIADATVCFADAGTNRRYECINNGVGKLGQCKDLCSGNNAADLHGWLQGIDRCDYCMCVCDESGVNSDRYFSLRSTESDIDHNKVVTGLRFVKKNRIIHLEIQEGKLLPRAQINLTTVHWIPAENYSIHDDNVREGQDYHTLEWGKRGFNLDDVFAKHYELVTGVRFVVVAYNLLFEIRVTPFNFKTGSLEVGKSKWKRNDVLAKNRKKVHLNNKDVPIRDPYRSLPASKSGMVLEFTHSDFVMDAAQTTVPFLDAQAVESALPVPLSGAGFMYKGSKKFGGFINPKIMTYDFSEVLINAYDDIYYN